MQHGPILFHGLCRTQQTRECTCHLEKHLFYHPERRRQISSRIRQGKYSTPNDGRTDLSSRRYIKFHLLLPFAANGRTTCALAKRCSCALSRSLYQRHCAVNSSKRVCILVASSQPFCDSWHCRYHCRPIVLVFKFIANLNTDAS